MPRVFQDKKSNRKSKPWRCLQCGKDIEAGQEYYYWFMRIMGIRRKHVLCGRPRPTQLSNAKTAAVQEAVEDAINIIGSWNPEAEWGVDNGWSVSDDASTIEDAISEVVSSANEVADEYDSSADALPENLQNGSQAEALHDVAERLREWAGTLENFSPDDSSNIEWPETDVNDFDTWDDAFEAANESVREWADGVRSEAESALQEEVPEYGS